MDREFEVMLLTELEKGDGRIDDRDEVEAVVVSKELRSAKRLLKSIDCKGLTAEFAGDVAADSKEKHRENGVSEPIVSETEDGEEVLSRRWDTGVNGTDKATALLSEGCC
jgi:NhaP-type Na+/H+ and K+/H+ antiporter